MEFHSDQHGDIMNMLNFAYNYFLVNLPLFWFASIFATIFEMVLKGEIDLAVHSAKDVPTRIQNGLEITSVIKRVLVQ